MRSSVLRVALAAILLAVLGCSVTHADIDRWKRTVRGPGKITGVLVGTRYPRDLRVHAARALIEMRHPNANGLELLNQAMASMAPADRDAILHDVLPSLNSQMRGVGQQGAAGPSEPQIRAKDAGYLLLRYTTGTDRQELSNELLEWILADLNTRALAGQYTAEQIVSAIGAPATDRLIRAYNSNEDSVRVAVPISNLINSVATDAGKDQAATRLVVVTREVLGPQVTERLRTTARQLLLGANPGQPVPDARLNQVTEQVRDQYLGLLFEAIKQLNRPAGNEFLIALAANPAYSLDRRKLALAGVAGQVRASDAPALMAIATNTTQTDLELRGAAIDRVGESRAPNVIPQLWQLFDTFNLGETDNAFQFRWKIGEAIIKLGTQAIIPEFARHVALPRDAARSNPPNTPFEGYTYREINGYASAIGDFTPPPLAAMRALLASPSPYVRAMALLFLGSKGDASDLPRIDALLREPTVMQGGGWTQESLPTLGTVAVRARNTLRHALTLPVLPDPPPPVLPAAPGATTPAAGAAQGAAAPAAGAPPATAGHPAVAAPAPAAAHAAHPTAPARHSH
jgi:hypothetical protein